MAQIYDKYRKQVLDNLPTKQVQAMAKYKPGRYILPAEVEDVEEEFEFPEPNPTFGKITETDVKDDSNGGVDNSNVDATRGAIALANEHGIDLNELYQGERILKQDVQNFINE